MINWFKSLFKKKKDLKQELNKLRAFLKGLGDETEYTDTSLIFSCAKHLGRVKTVKWNEVKWFSTFYTMNDNFLIAHKKTDTSAWGFWNNTDVLIIEGMDLDFESNCVSHSFTNCTCWEV